MCLSVCVCVCRYAGDDQWAETGDRYLLKLFRDYMFHQVLPSGQPWVDLAHIVQTLNKVSPPPATVPLYSSVFPIDYEALLLL